MKATLTYLRNGGYLPIAPLYVYDVEFGKEIWNSEGEADICDYRVFQQP